METQQQPAQYPAQSMPPQQPEEQYISDPEPQRPRSPLVMGLIGFFVVAAIAGGSYYLGLQQGVQEQVTQKAAANITPTAIPSPTPDSTANWLTYSNEKYKYSVKYPSQLKATEVNRDYYYLQFDNQQGTLPPYVISVIPDTFVVQNIAAYNLMSSDYINELIALKTGQSKTTNTGTVLTKMPDVRVDGESAAFISVSAVGFKQHRVYIKKNGFIYMISDYYQGQEDLQSFTTFLSTFKFL